MEIVTQLKDSVDDVCDRREKLRRAVKLRFGHDQSAVGG